MIQNTKQDVFFFFLMWAIVMVGLALLLTGCTWVKPNSTDQEFAADDSYCNFSAETIPNPPQAQPVAIHQAGAQGLANGLAQLAFALQKRGMYHHCMHTRGWQ